MKIGLDFDNTVANYDVAFQGAAKESRLVDENWSGDKRELRAYIHDLPNGEKRWQRLQGQVYSRWMHQAVMMDGAAWFLHRCRVQGIQIVIVSHKTEFGHYDLKKLPLREIAKGWMKNQGFFDADGFGINESSIYFENTRAEKIQRIVSLQVSHFVDDLPEVFQEPGFPATTDKILFFPEIETKPKEFPFTVCTSWSAVSGIILGGEKEQELNALAQIVVGRNHIQSSTLAATGGNSSIYKVSTDKGQTFALKRYPFRHSDKRDRLGTEANACRFLQKEGIKVVPKYYSTNVQLNVNLFEWIEGTKILKPDSRGLSQLLDFVQQLQRLRPQFISDKFSMASEACLSGAELIRQINHRREALERITQDNLDLELHLTHRFDPLWKTCQRWIDRKWTGSVSLNEILPRERQILSPSDFGFHNALQEAGHLRILDLEYFGWDDPVKLVSEFWWHPGMNLDEQLKSKWFSETSSLFVNNDPDFLTRINALHPAFGLRWALIVLNVYLRDHEGNTIDHSYPRVQLGKFERLCEMTRNWMNDEQQII